MKFASRHPHRYETEVVTPSLCAQRTSVHLLCRRTLVQGPTVVYSQEILRTQNKENTFAEAENRICLIVDLQWMRGQQRIDFRTTTEDHQTETVS